MPAQATERLYEVWVDLHDGAVAGAYSVVVLMAADDYIANPLKLRERLAEHYKVPVAQVGRVRPTTRETYRARPDTLPEGDWNEGGLACPFCDSFMGRRGETGDEMDHMVAAHHDIVMKRMTTAGYVLDEAGRWQDRLAGSDS